MTLCHLSGKMSRLSQARKFFSLGIYYSSFSKVTSSYHSVACPTQSTCQGTCCLPSGCLGPAVLMTFPELPDSGTFLLLSRGLGRSLEDNHDRKEISMRCSFQRCVLYNNTYETL